MIYAELILGCMTSGKSTEMLRRINRRLLLKANKILYVRPASDTREQITHDHKTTTAETCVVSRLMELAEKALEYDAVFVDEVQFFEDAPEFLIYVEQQECRLQYIVFCGLSGDSERKPWPVVTNLIPLMDNVSFKKALCIDCGDGQEAAFSKCCVEKKDKIMIGNTYRATCRSHFLLQL